MTAGKPDYVVIALTVLLTLVGLVAVYSASFVIGLADYGDSRHFIVRQGVWAVLGTLLMLGAMRIDYRRYRNLAVPIMGVTLLMLLMVLVIGVTTNGAKRWIGVGAFTIQPAEFAKLAVIIYLAAWLEGKGDRLKTFQQGMLPFIVIIGLVGFLIMMQPSLGTTMVISLVTVTMFWVAGATVGQMLSLGGAGVVVVGLLATMQGYRMERLTAFFDAEMDPQGNGFQTLQSLIAMGNGGLTGLGLGASRAKFFYIPESHTDGVFAILGEELGLIAGAAVLLLFMLFMWQGYRVSMRSRDQFGQLMATGITTWVVVQALLNIGGITRVIPLAGVPLPFLSFGGSALAAVLLAVGVLVSISRYGTTSGAQEER